MSDLNTTPMGIQVYSGVLPCDLSFGEALSKFARHRLTLLCLESIERDLLRASKLDERKGRGRGRPQSPATILSIKIGVGYDSINRWRNPTAIQSCDANAVKLARVAFEYDAPATVRILEEDIQRHREAIESWVRQADPQNNSSKLDELQDNPHNIVAGACD